MFIFVERSCAVATHMSAPKSCKLFGYTQGKASENYHCGREMDEKPSKNVPVKHNRTKSDQHSQTNFTWYGLLESNEHSQHQSDS